MAGTIKAMKSLYWKEETNFGEAYDPAADFQEVAMAEFSVDDEPEDLTTLYMNKARVLSEDHASGRDNGGATFQKNLGSSLMGTFSGPLGTAIGTLVPKTGSASITAVSVTSGIVTLLSADTSGLAVGDIVQFVTTAGTYLAFNRIASIDDDVSVTFAEEVCLDEVSRYEVAALTGTLHQASYLRPSVPDMSKTYQFVAVYQDDTVAVFRGASLKGSFSIATDGKAVIDFEIQAAIVQKVDTVTKLALAAPSGGTITPEEVDNPTVFNFQTSTMYDFANSTYKMEFPYKVELNFGNTIEPITKTGCINNIGGWYIKPDITGNISVEHNAENLVNFSKIYEGANDGTTNSCRFFTSSKDFAFYSPFTKYTNVSLKDVDSYDSIDCMLNVNSWVTSEPLMVFPQTYA